MKRSILAHPATVLALSALLPFAAAAQQSEVAVSPFVTFLPTAGASPLAGLALTLAGNGGLALRASGHLSLENNNNSLNATNSLRPWGGDLDAVLFIGGRYFGGHDHALSPYAFAGLGIAGRDSLGRMMTTNNWSYGAGLNVPLGSAIDLFGESRWRMSRYVLPTSSMAPSPAQEFRVGLSFHIGAGGTSHSRGATRASRHSLQTCSEPR